MIRISTRHCSSPPVILTVCNRTETAARIEHYFNSGDAVWPELEASEKTLRVDSKVLEKAEIGETATTNKAYEARLAEIIGASGFGRWCCDVAFEPAKVHDIIAKHAA
jgi:hypothetical protein